MYFAKIISTHHSDDTVSWFTVACWPKETKNLVWMDGVV